jgi:hypothetical protein
MLLWQRASYGAVLPFQDGSHHVANVADRVADLRTQGLSTLFSRGVEDVSLAYAFFMVPTFLLGGGRLAFAAGWVVCAVALLGVVWTQFRTEKQKWARSLAIGLFLCCGLFQAVLGGARDTRIDLLSVTLVLIGLIALTSGRTLDAILVLLAAAFAKSAAVALVVPLTVLAIVVFQFAPLTPPWRIGRTGLAKTVVAIGAACLYITQLGQSAVFYNLMAAGGTTVGERVNNFGEGALRYLTRDPLFYVRELTASRSAWVLFVAFAACFAVGVIRRWPRELLKVGVFAMCVVAYDLLLLTISPLHEQVLAVWLLPGLGLMAMFTARTAARQLPSWLVGCLALCAVAAVLPGLRVMPEPASATAREEIDQTLVQTDGFARFLNSAVPRPTSVAILANFLYFDPAGASNVDSYRVLLHEHLPPRTAMHLEGWELGPFSFDWKPSVLLSESSPHVAFILQENPMAEIGDNYPQKNGSVVFRWFQAFGVEHPGCLEPAAPPVQMGAAGTRLVLWLNETDDCRRALYDAMR